MEKLVIEAKTENLGSVTDFVNDKLSVFGCSPKTQMQIELTVEEIFVNIANYAYSPEDGMAEIEVEVKPTPLCAVITFSDSGVPYNPLEAEMPDTSLTADQRRIGGLGIFLVKKNMDNVSYEYKDGKNILTVSKGL